MKELRFSTKKSAIKYLSNIINKQIRIATAGPDNSDEEFYDDASEVINVINESKKVMKKFKETAKEKDELIEKIDKLMEESLKIQAELKELLSSIDDDDEAEKVAFVCENEAIQYLSDITGCRIIIESN